MDLSPNDIRNYEFPSQMRGYSKDDVDSFLETVAVALEQVKQENLKLSMETDSLKSQLTGLRQFEDTIKSAAIDARRNADMTISNAKKEAELILIQAKSEAEKVIESRTRELQRFEAQLARAGMVKKSYFAKLQSLIKSHLDMVESIAGDARPSDIRGDDYPESTEAAGRADSIEVTESSEVDRRTMETVAGGPSPSEPLAMEEANAAERIVTVEDNTSTPPTPDDEAAYAEMAATADDSVTTVEEEPKPIDPELATALQHYQQTQTEQPGETASPDANTEPTPEQGVFVETDRRAEDVPPGFVVKESDAAVLLQDDQSDPATDRVQVSGSRAADQSSGATGEQDQTIAPGKLADELDKVVAKFEEEMDKAAES
ncbi:MAG: DivIVA domain-containing protein [candidate division Zixibacteria bacterium]|nr:DivIVA domain-containing protein [candidate division Zixibacteria bacterium]